MQTLRERMKKLEEAQKDSVDSILSQIKHMVSVRGAPFNKDHLIDMLLTLKMVARESDHNKAGYFTAVLEAMREKLSVPDDQFKKYACVLLGDKDHERVLEAMAKVDKASKVLGNKQRGEPEATMRRGADRFANIKCFRCQEYGHYKSHCPEAARSQGRSSKKAKYN